MKGDNIMIIGNKLIKIETTVNASIEEVWNFWTTPEHITKWYTASEGWHTPKAENELIEGGKFLYRMEAKDGSFGFDYWGIYDEVKSKESLVATLGDGRKVSVSFEPYGESTKIVETFEPETENSLEHQQMGWQAILDNFKRYVETYKHK